MAPGSPATHVAYADETRYNYGRFRGVGMVSAPEEGAPALSGEVRALLDASGVAECKWEKIRGARGGFAAEKLLGWAVEAALAGRLRVDVLTWDAEAAGGGAGVPHVAMLRRMYARLVGEILPARWPVGSRFALYPDEQGAVAWERLAAGMAHIARIEPRRSEDEPLIQVADLFAGLGVFSRGNYAIYQRWLCYPPAERSGAGGAGARLPFSASDRVRCRLLDDFFTLSKYRWLGISLRTHGGLRTYRADRPLCFWWG